LSVLTTTTSPSTTGETVRPPCVEISPNSSVSWRCQSTLPAASSACSEPSAPKA
jgi:hypothetical protein